MELLKVLNFVTYLAFCVSSLLREHNIMITMRY